MALTRQDVLSQAGAVGSPEPLPPLALLAVGVLLTG